MNHSSFSNTVSRYQSVTSKSSNSSVSSILRDSSAGKSKMKRSVRFEDSPVLSEKPVPYKPMELYNQITAPSTSVNTPAHSYLTKFKPKLVVTTKEIPTKAFSSNNTPTGRSPIKEYPVQETLTDISEIPEPRFVPKVLNYSFRTANFYNKLNKFYLVNQSEKNSTGKISPETINIKLEINDTAKENSIKKLQNGSEESSVIHLRPCSMQKAQCRSRVSRSKNSSPVRDGKQFLQKKQKNLHGQNILN